ncbi:ComF family protein [Saccharicrinis aurantiacus]|uniref:ComF family protein n=1 Tax=Saccharicrinis aurantiacus TaxID=1849719 RepID=UPI0024919A75|nr:phosphoribosyltransferase family protein [Saccharicrinis aurantiacus]
MMKFLISFFELFFPNNCELCSNSLYKHENYICGKCKKKLPRTYFNMVKTNPAEQSLWGRIDIEHVHCFLFYAKENSTQQMLHTLKYKGEKELGKELAHIFADELEETHSLKGVDILIPVPLHPKKLFKRGYNQSEWIAKGIQEKTNLPIDNTTLIKAHNTESQTRKNRFSRYLSSKEMFSINDKHKLKGKHILLIDDVLTTGATIEACYNALANTDDIKVSILTLAYSSK